jgi:hypothetical protein
MLVATLGMTGLLGWCIFKVITKGDAGRLHAPLDIDTKDD